MTTPLPKDIGRPATNALKSVNVTSLENLCKMSEVELSNLHGVGPKAIAILRQSVSANKMSLAVAKNIKSVSND